MQIHVVQTAALSLVLLLPACSSGGGGGGSTTVSGEVQFVPDALFTSSTSGAIDSTRETLALAPGRSVRVRGRLEDGRDAQRLRSSQRVSVVARLDAASAASLAHVDLLSLVVGQAGREVRFLARGPFELVVHGRDGEYGFDVGALPVTGPVELDGHLGAFLVGDELALLAHDATRGRLSCAETLDLAIASSGELIVLDLDGREVARLGPAGGELRLEGAPLASFELVARGPHATPIQIRALAAASPRPCARVRPLAAERAAFNLGGDAVLATAVTEEFVAGELLVRARPGLDLAGDIARRAGRVTLQVPETSDLVAVDLPAGLDAQEAARTTLALIAAFETSERVEWAEPNRIRRGFGGTREPDDSLYPLQWHYQLMRLPQAWNLTIGDAGVIVAVIDTGSRPHPDLDANTNLLEDFDFISGATNAGDGNGVDADSTDVGDGNALKPSSFHGTHVAGTIGAVSDNGSGVAGVNWVVEIMHLRVLGKQGGTDADISNAIRYAAGLSSSAPAPPARRASVINMSLGGPGSSSTTQNAVTAARNAGVVIFAAAGNQNSSQRSFPASFAGVVSVSAVDLNAEKAPYSNFGSTVDLAAPGGDSSVDLNGDGFGDGVLSTLVDENEVGLPPIFVFYQGTSMACPHAAGVAALMLSANPALTPAQIEGFLQSTALDLGAVGRDDVFGHGLIQADLAVAAALGSTSPTPQILASPSALEFGSETTQLTIGVQNSGGGTLDVGTPTFTPNGADPVFATLQAVPSGGTSDISAVTVTVDRSGLADGSYSGVVDIPSTNGGTAAVAVAMDVFTPPTPLDVPLFLLLIDAVTLDTLAQADLNPNSVLAWTIQSGPSLAIPSGDYMVVCGSDEENDLDIFDVGDVYRGAWPTLEEIEVLSLAGGTTLSALDFVVAPSQQTLNIHPGFPPPGGFRLLRPPGGLVSN